MTKLENSYPLLSIIMPVRNEAGYIEMVLNNIFAQNYPREKIEVIIVDGESDDQTLDIINTYNVRHLDLKIITISNRERIVPSGLNLAIGYASGEVIVRMDAHAEYPEDYLPRLVDGLKRYDADNVGGVVETIPPNPKSKSKAIAFAMGHPAGVGNSFFRIGASAPMEVDTVPFGCFFKSVFDKIGLFDEELVRNQDDEFNGRMRRSGMKIVLLPDLKIKYFARDSWHNLFRMFYQYGLFKPLVVKKLGLLPTWRQLIPPVFVLFLFWGGLLSFFFTLFSGLFLFFAGLYVIILSWVALQSAFRNNFGTFFYVIGALFLMHISYGLGYLKGILAVLVKKNVFFKIMQTSR
ncbi:glycosyltransferase family 2 protein [Marinilabilia salmonicolor]|uniref:glycosyltransferase family 2 protein n=1 Tax=Marinilabilia salmonicolor TaxID=989 RepID=UPI00029AACD0|nr:glycosyltransferase family 2 protein [Marinilabilia salmonicolor]